MAKHKDEISPKMLMLKARVLYALNRKWECKRILEIYWAFWQNRPELKEHYEWYYPKVKNAKQPKVTNKPSAVNDAITPQFHSAHFGRVVPELSLGGTTP